MSDSHYAFWPKSMPRHMTMPQTNIFFNAIVSAARFPNKPYMIFYDTPVTFAEFFEEAEQIAGYLETECGVKKGDRVLLVMQNSPQCAIAYYGILRANAVVVPVNPMNLTNELRHYVKDSGASVAFTGQETYPNLKPLLTEGLASGDTGGLKHVIVAAYADYIRRPTDLKLPDAVAAPRQAIGDAGAVLWSDALARNWKPGPQTAGPDDLCVMPYTSGTTGQPKGCMHTHRSVMYTMVAGRRWYQGGSDDVSLSVLPYFHVTGMQGGLNGAIFGGNTVVLMQRWDRDLAAQLIERYKVTSCTFISTMVVDFLSSPNAGKYDLSSLTFMSGGGAAMPEAVAKKLEATYGLQYMEGYGLSETMSPTHLNPPDRPKKQCLGMPISDTEARVVDPATMKQLAAKQIGEIIVRGPQVFQGYWNNPDATRQAFVEIDGKTFFRTGDLGYVDEEGYYFFTDRLKRMINAAGMKVWPAEVEAILYGHPAIQEACIIAALDDRRGETVKAMVVLKPGHQGTLSEQDIIAWSREQMAAYKVPRIVTFIDTLPKSATGKINWRAMQDAEKARA